jgi:hypothetical protein
MGAYNFTLYSRLMKASQLTSWQLTVHFNVASNLLASYSGVNAQRITRLQIDEPRDN